MSEAVPDSGQIRDAVERPLLPWWGFSELDEAEARGYRWRRKQENRVYDSNLGAQASRALAPKNFDSAYLGAP